MSDLYERLLAEVESLEDAIPQPGGTCEALRAVLELHKPTERTWSWGAVDIECDGCAHDAPSWPCETVRAIARALGVEVDGG